jgi:hypothetical protein
MARYSLEVLLYLCALLVLSLLPTIAPASQPHATPQVDVHFVTDEADAVLALLKLRAEHRPIADADWKPLFESEGYTRLKKREAAMHRAFQDDDFKAFVQSGPLLAKYPFLGETLRRWKQANVRACARRALAYLPREAHIHAKVYPVIKPRPNSFVFETDTNPAIFLALDPGVSRPKLENTMAHELHHIGYASCCPSREAADQISRLPERTRTVINWIGAFGEGYAMLAAAGGPDIHPHAVSSAADQARWDRDVANFDADLGQVEQFFKDVLSGKLATTDQINEVAFSFFGIQGPWYTVGWKMSVVIEKTFGRSRLLDCMRDPRKLLPTFNAAAREYNPTASTPLRLWSEDVVAAIEVKPQPSPSSG